MRSATTRYRPSSAKRRDPWDEDELGEDDSYGPSWTKAYVGGMKVRQYAVSAVDVALPAVQQQPTSSGRQSAGRRS